MSALAAKCPARTPERCARKARTTRCRTATSSFSGLTSDFQAGAFYQPPPPPPPPPPPTEPPPLLLELLEVVAALTALLKLLIMEEAENTPPEEKASPRLPEYHEGVTAAP